MQRRQARFSRRSQGDHHVEIPSENGKVRLEASAGVDFDTDLRAWIPGAEIGERVDDDVAVPGRGREIDEVGVDDEGAPETTRNSNGLGPKHREQRFPGPSGLRRRAQRRDTKRRATEMRHPERSYERGRTCIRKSAEMPWGVRQCDEPLFEMRCVAADE